jgi:hypothetical protein
MRLYPLRTAVAALIRGSIVPIVRTCCCQRIALDALTPSCLGTRIDDPAAQISGNCFGQACRPH